MIWGSTMKPCDGRGARAAGQYDKLQRTGGGWSRMAATLATLCGVAAGLPGCARATNEQVQRTSNADATLTTTSVAAAYDAIKLQMLARAHEIDARGASGRDRIDPPVGLDGDALRMLSESELSATSPRMLPLADVLAQLASPAASPTLREGEGASLDALKLYGQGRMALAAGNAAEATTALEAAARIAPDSPQIWRSLGEAQLALSRRASGLSSLRKAVSLGLREPGTLFQLAREARKAGRPDEAAPMLARVLTDAGLDRVPDGNRAGVDGARIDPGLAMLALIEASSALEEAGHSRASLEALTIGLSIPMEEVSQTSYRDEVGEAMRFRSAQWMAGGDLAMRLGDAATARQMYDRAAEGTMLDPAPLLARRVYASLLEGNGARASLAVLDDIERMRGRVDERQVGLIEYVAAHADGEMLARAIGALAEQRGDAIDLTATTRSRLARAQAAALKGHGGEARAREVLERASTLDAMDVDLQLALVQTFPSNDATGLTRAMARVVDAEPLAATTAANAVIADGRIASQVVALSGRDVREPGAALFTGVMLAKAGREQDALERVRPVADSSSPSAGAYAVAIMVAMDAGAWSDVTRWADALAANPDPAALRAKVIGLSAAQRPKEAKAAADVLAQGPDATVRDLIADAEMALGAGDTKAAEMLIRDAVLRDRYDERGYEAALQLHGPRGPLPNQSKASQAGAALRQMIPASRLIRLVTAQELASRSLWRQATEAAQDLLEPTSEQSGVLDLYVTGIERSAQTDPELAAKGEAMLRARVDARPQSPMLRIALARVLAAMDRGADAEAVLVEGYAAIAIPDLARARERVVRDALADPVRADALAEARLAAAPRNIDNTIELAQFRVRKGEYGRAAAALREGLPASIALPLAQTGRLASMVDGLTADQVAKRSSEAAAGALELLDAVAGRPEVRLSEQIDATRVALTAEADPTNAARLLEACADLARRHPRLGLATYARVAEVLLAKEDVGPALKFLRGASAQIEPASDALMFETYRLTVLRGGREDYIALADELDDATRLTTLLNAITQKRAATNEVASLRAEVLYLVANALSSIDKTQEAYWVYDEVLRRDPKHAWANNNYGYALLSREHDLARAKPMIEAAYEAAPTEASIIDSMGWLRYHENRLDDERVGDAAIIPGAIKLLTTAADVADEDSTPEVFTHLGDALWRAGRKDEALTRWDVAAKIGRARLAEIDAQRRERANQPADQGDDQVESRYVNELRTLVESAEQRAAAVREGGEPRIVVQLGVPGSDKATP